MPLRKTTKTQVSTPVTPSSIPSYTQYSPASGQTFLLTLLLLLSIFANGVLWTKVQFYEKGASTTPTTNTTTTQTGQQKPTVTLDTIKNLFTSKNLAFGDKNR